MVAAKLTLDSSEQVPATMGLHKLGAWVAAAIVNSGCFKQAVARPNLDNLKQVTGRTSWGERRGNVCNKFGHGGTADARGVVEASMRQGPLPLGRLELARRAGIGGNE